MTPQLNKVHRKTQAHTHTYTQKGCLCSASPTVTFSLPDLDRQNPILWDTDTLLSFAPSLLPPFLPFSRSAAPSRGDGGRRGWRLDRWRRVIHRYTFSLRFAPAGMVWWRGGERRGCRGKNKEVSLRFFFYHSWEDRERSGKVPLFKHINDDILILYHLLYILYQSPNRNIAHVLGIIFIVYSCPPNSAWHKWYL